MKEQVIKLSQQLENAENPGDEKATDRAPQILHENVHINFIHNHQKLEATKMSFNKQLNQQIAILNTIGILFNGNKE